MQRHMTILRAAFCTALALVAIGCGTTAPTETPTPGATTTTPVTEIPAPTTTVVVDQQPVIPPAPVVDPAVPLPPSPGDKTPPTPDDDDDNDDPANEATSALTAVWANDGGDKVTREALRASGDPTSILNTLWDGTTIQAFGAKNEVIGFSLLLEAATTTVEQVSVTLDTLTGPNGATIASQPTTGNGVFDWTARPIELFFIRYLQIQGLSRLAYESYYDERHVPARLRRPWTGNGEPLPDTGWVDRPDHDTYYPEIAVPMELVPSFAVPAGENQGVWVDIYIPKTVPAGIYTGIVRIAEDGVVTREIPVRLAVRNFTLPDTPSARTMLFLGYQDINTRYLASKEPWPWTPDDIAQSQRVRDRHFLLAHRHRIPLIDADYGNDNPGDAPHPEWLPRLNGALFTAAHGYDGPGVGVGNGVYSIGTYGQHGLPNGWLTQGAEAVQTHSDAWVNWFAANAPTTEYFIYMNDECGGFANDAACFTALDQWAAWIDGNPGPGKALLSMATLSIPNAVASVPHLDIPTSPSGVGITSVWQAAVDLYDNNADKRVYYYNGRRPISGSFATEDDGVALRQIAWSQFKKRIDRWFFWESTYYNNYQGGTGQTNVFQQAKTFGGDGAFDATHYGATGWNYGNGDGVLFYPGTDHLFPAESYGLDGPIASLRLKLWRRGIQDVDYLTMAAAIDPVAVQQIVAQLIPEVLWEVGVDNPADPTYVHADISWPTNPDAWETARAHLADIIEGGQ